MRAHAREGFGSIAEAADAVAAYLPHRPRPRSHEGLKKNLRLHPDGRWRWHWDPRFLEGNRRDRRRLAPRSSTRWSRRRKRITIPTLLVRGGSSELVQEEHAKDFLEAGAARRPMSTSAAPATWWPATATTSSPPPSESFLSNESVKAAH